MKDGKRDGRASIWGEMEQGCLGNQAILPVLCFAFCLAKSLLISCDGAGSPEAPILVSHKLIHPTCGTWFIRTLGG